MIFNIVYILYCSVSFCIVLYCVVLLYCEKKGMGGVMRSITLTEIAEGYEVLEYPRYGRIYAVCCRMYGCISSIIPLLNRMSTETLIPNPHVTQTHLS